MWRYRERLSTFEKLRRSVYETLRDTLERHLMKISLIDSYMNYKKAGVEYTFVDKSELRIKGKRMEKESELFNTFLIIFCEGVVSPELKNYLRFFPENSFTKKNFEYLPDLSFSKHFHKNLRYFEHPQFLEFLEPLLDVDYALLIQQDPTVKKTNRYSLTHFHVKVDWPIADAAEDLAKSLRYIQTNLYEGGDHKARLLQNKLFEYYGCHHSVGGRRTAGLIAAQLLRRLDFFSTVFVSSSEARSMFKYSERGVSKFFLVHLTGTQMEGLAQREGMSPQAFQASYLYRVDNDLVGISEACYSRTPHSLPPEDGRLRPLRPAYNWLRLSDEFLHPNIHALEAKPITCVWTPPSVESKGQCA